MAPAVILRALLVAAAFLAGAAEAQTGPARVSPDARAIHAWRLTPDLVAKVDQVTRAMDGHVPPSREASRADVALAVVLTMSWAYNEPWRDATVDEQVRTIDAGHPELRAAIRAAGLSTREYVLTQMALLLAYPVVAARKQGRAVAMPSDVAAENLAFVEARWTEVDAMMTRFYDRVAAERRRSGAR